MKRVLLPLLSAALLIAAFPNFNCYPSAWIGLIPLLFAIDGKKPLGAFLCAFTTGVIFFLGTVYWLIHVTLPGMIAVVLYLALFFGAFGLIASPPIERPSYASLFILPAAWVALEYARSHLFGGFGWNLLAHSQSGNLSIIQIADITGAYGVSFLIVLVNTAVYFTVKDIVKRNYSTFYLAVAIILIFASLGYGNIRLNNIFTGERLKVAVIQGNIPQHAKWNAAFRRMIVDRYTILTETAAQSEPDLVIWPETSVPGFLDLEPDLNEWVSSLAATSKSALLVGEPRQGSADSGACYNSATLFDKSGKSLGLYDKIHLVPFGEFIPAKRIFSFVEKFTKATIGDLSPGREYTVFSFIVERSLRTADRTVRSVRKVRFSALICFEDIFPDISREFVRRGAVFLVNMTNDAWFGNTCAPYQHLQNSVFRAVENRVNVIRAANTGISCFIDQKGRVLRTVGAGDKVIFIEGFAIGDITLTNTRTFYTKYGDVLAYLCIALSLISILYLIRSKNHIKDGAVQ